MAKKPEAKVEAAGQGIARTFQNIRLFGNMRVLDNIYAELDGRFEETAPKPTDPLKSGGPAPSFPSANRAASVARATSPPSAESSENAATAFPISATGDS